MILNKGKILEQARAFIDEGKYDKAIREYEKIILADPDDLRVKLRVAELYTKRKQITEAIRIYREVADVYSAEGFFLKAVTVYKNILRLNPSLTEINEQLASLYEKMGLVADAIRQYDIVATALDLKGETAQGIAIRTKIVRLNPSDNSQRIKLAEIYQRDGKMDEAINQYEEYARQIEKGGADRALLADVFEKILAHRPSHDMLRRLITICDELGDRKRALKWLEAGKDVVEGDPDLLNMMARIYASQKQNESARARYIMLADLYKEAGRIDEALGAYCEILALLPEDEDRLARRIEELRPGALPLVVEQARNRREEMEKEETQRQEAMDALKTAEPQPPADLKSQDKPNVKKELPEEKKQDVRFEPPNRKEGDAAFDLGMLYKKTGLNEEAIAEFGRAKDIYETCIKRGVKDPDIPNRLAEIDGEMKKEIKKGDEKPPPPVIQKPKPVVVKEMGKKKKVSFV